MSRKISEKTVETEDCLPNLSGCARMCATRLAKAGAAFMAMTGVVLALGQPALSDDYYWPSGYASTVPSANGVTYSAPEKTNYEAYGEPCPMQPVGGICYVESMDTQGVFASSWGRKISVAYELEPSGQSGDDVLLLQLGNEYAVLEEANQLCILRVWYRYDSNRMEIERYLPITTESGTFACTPVEELARYDYEVLDQLVPEGDGVHKRNLRSNIFVGSDFMWIETIDRDNPVFGQVYSSPAFFGGANIVSQPGQEQYIGASPISTNGYDMVRLSGNDPAMSFSPFVEGNLLNEVQIKFSQKTEYPLVNRPAVAAGVMAAAILIGG